MTCTEYCATQNRPRPELYEFLKKRSAFPKAYWGERTRRARRNNDMRKLRHMSDAGLADIGLRRTDVDARFEDLGKVRPDLAAFLSR